ncbi:hypothetical protein EOC93_25265 [Mesorhizobium sp. M6A.T.Ce.TU.002.03.1.1]|uniref:hypothetical protein n=1 Tax=Mesorhizobium sp. M6A.T.Ce.TU.002.03.1.1 TaxID=2496782 RepID=UPI000FCC5997|nr:hypothetical protein [Mesorhizobium sp. M6A.T.Ce.TU.002.03.1.1]RUU36347.1 hypothetical protein EOC93_25265 [Mesorhizobium sp. M6A.T.Ce.TU.002.03.1.1]
MKARSVRIEGNTVYVPLARDGTREAVIDFDDFRDLQLLGLNPNWHSKGGNVMALGSNGVLVVVSRVLMDAKEGQVVSHENKDRLDLRRGNLSLAAGFSVNHDRALLSLDRAERLKASEDRRSELSMGRPIIKASEDSFDKLFSPA